jgi:hypothetical protein
LLQPGHSPGPNLLIASITSTLIAGGVFGAVGIGVFVLGHLLDAHARAEENTRNVPPGRAPISQQPNNPSGTIREPEPVKTKESRKGDRKAQRSTGPSVKGTSNPRSTPAQINNGPESTVVGAVTIQPGAVASFGQQGGLTAGTINITPIQPMPDLTDLQKSKMEHDLNQGGSHTIAVRFTQGNERSQYLANQFKDLIQLSGWTLRRPKFLIEETIARGIFILVDEDEASSPPEAATMLTDALTHSGLPPRIVAVPGLGRGNVDLAIGIP